MTIVFDIDDTLCDNNGRDYENAIPFTSVISKINHLHDDENIRIVLYTARGMKSCEGNIEKIKEKNEKILITWLKQHDVHYDELVFGKPLGDVYVDDKCMEVREFLNSDFHTLNGGSNLSIYRLGRYVIKDLGSHEKTLSFKKWMKESKDMCHTPHVVSYLYNEVYLDFIEGKSLVESLTPENFINLLTIISSFKEKKYSHFNIETLIERVKKNSDDKLFDKVQFCVKKLYEYKDFLKENASFCHGDCTLSNIINHNNELYFLDENWYEDASSYLLDFGKLRCSFQNYEYVFNISNTKNSNYLKMFDDYLKLLNIYEIVVLLEYMWFIRMYNYKSDEDKNKVIKMLEIIEQEQGWKIN